jgi:hypothetical protein
VDILISATTQINPLWRTFCGISRAQSIYPVTSKPNHQYGSKSFFRALPHTKSVPQQHQHQPENACKPEK